MWNKYEKWMEKLWNWCDFAPPHDFHIWDHILFHIIFIFAWIPRFALFPSGRSLQPEQKSWFDPPEIIMAHRISILIPHPQYPAVPASILPLRRLVGRSAAYSVGLVPGNSFTGHDLAFRKIWNNMQYMWQNITLTAMTYKILHFLVVGARGPGPGCNFHIIVLSFVIFSFIFCFHIFANASFPPIPICSIFATWAEKLIWPPWDHYDI